MQIKKEELKKISALCKININESENKKFSNQISQVFDCINKIKKYKFLDKKFEKQGKEKKLRKDVVLENDSNQLIDQFNEKEGNLLKVKKVL